MVDKILQPIPLHIQIFSFTNLVSFDKYYIFVLTMRFDIIIMSHTIFGNKKKIQYFDHNNFAKLTAIQTCPNDYEEGLMH